MFLKYNRAGLAWALVIFILCALPGKSIPKIDWLEMLKFDKLVHFTMFLILVYLLIKGFTLQFKFASLKRSPAFYAVLFSIPYGGLLELMQGTFYTERSGSILDFTANSIGSFTGIWLYSFLKKREFRLFGIRV